MPDEAPAKSTPAAKKAPRAPKTAPPSGDAAEKSGTPSSTPSSPSAPSTPETPAATPPASPARKTPPPRAKRVPGAESKPKPKAAPSPSKAPLAEKPEASLDIPPTATVVDASGLVLGRAASLIAQRLLKGETVVVLNAERSVVTGNRAMVIREFVAARAQGSVRSGPHYPRFPDRIFRRTVRGMLPHLKTRGKVALDRLHVFIGTPPGLGPRTPVTLDQARSRPALRPPTTLAEISTLLGAHL